MCFIKLREQIKIEGKVEYVIQEIWEKEKLLVQWRRQVPRLQPCINSDNQEDGWDNGDFQKGNRTDILSDIFYQVKRPLEMEDLGVEKNKKMSKTK